MKTGIAVLYMVSERNGPLMDLHLRKIEQNTVSPYTIYASTSGLFPGFRDKLAANPRVKICECEDYPGGDVLWRSGNPPPQASPDAPRIGRYEHSWYLEQLMHTAVMDGVTHLAVFHVDSFPVRRGWDVELAGLLSDKCVMAAVVRDQVGDRKPLTAGMFFSSDFYRRCEPRLLLPPQTLDSDDYRRYQAEMPHFPDSGTGYGFLMFTKGLGWHQLVRSNLGGDHSLLASIYGDMIFHLHATVHVERTGSVGFSSRSVHRRGLVGAAARAAHAFLPDGIVRAIRKRRNILSKLVFQSMDRKAWETGWRRLIEDPDAYIEYLRTGKQP